MPLRAIVVVNHFCNTMIKKFRFETALDAVYNNHCTNAVSHGYITTRTHYSCGSVCYDDVGFTATRSIEIEY